MMPTLSNVFVDLSYALLKVPLPLPVPPSWLGIVPRAQAEFAALLSSTEKLDWPRPFTVHRFQTGKGLPKALVVHGWMSRSLYMTKMIRHLVRQGYEVTAIDIPCHGKSPGFALSWQDTVNSILATQEKFGPFQLGVGHSYGGAMMLNSTGIGRLSHEIHGRLEVDKMILIAALTKVKTATGVLAKKFKLNRQQREELEKRVSEQAQLDLDQLDGVYLQKKFPTQTEFLCIHDQNDKVVPFSDSLYFAQLGQRVKVHATEGLGHMQVIYDEGVFKAMNRFLAAA